MNDFHIYEEIGQGRHSTVYKGRKKASITYVAIKSVDKKQMDKVLREVKIIYRLKHANILRFHNWYETRNHLWLILEYCTGGDLLHVLTQDRQLPESTVKVLGVDLLSGLQHLHHSGILYCDLKPSNVLIDEYGVLKLCDFGLARSIPTDQDEVQATKRGTPCYMAPELFTDDGVYSCASDLWALGCILYEMVVGVPPFVSNSFEDLVNMVLTSPVPKPAIGNDGSVVRLSKSLRHLLEGLLTKVPSERMTWNVLLQHPFWNARPTPPEADIPPQPLFEASVQKFHTERRRSMERKQRVTVSSSSSADGQGDSRNSNSNGTEQEYENGRDQGESSEEYEENRRSLDQSNTMRMSRIARENLERDQSRDTYGASSSFHKNNEDDDDDHEDEENNINNKKRNRKNKKGGMSGLNLEISNVDAELDFDEKSSPVSMPGRNRKNQKKNEKKNEKNEKKEDSKYSNSSSGHSSGHSSESMLDSSRSNEAAVLPMGVAQRHNEMHNEMHNDRSSSSSIRSLRDEDGRREEEDTFPLASHNDRNLTKNTYNHEDEEDIEEEELHPSPMKGRRRPTPSTPTTNDPSYQVSNNNQERRAQSARPAPRSSSHSSNQHDHERLRQQQQQQRPSSTSKMTQQRSASPSGLSGSPTAMSAWDTPSNTNTMHSHTAAANGGIAPFVLPVRALTSHVEIARMLSSVPARQVSPISGNDAIERTSPLRYNAATLARRLTPIPLSEVARMEQQTLEEFLTAIYRALDEPSATVSERVHVLGYFSTLCGVASVANQLVNSSLMVLLARMLKRFSSVPNILCGINHVLAKLFRHATYISDNLSKDGMLIALVKCVGGRDRKVRRRAMGALGELLFYVTTEEDNGSNKNGSDSNGWVIPGSVVPLLHRCLKSEDAVLAHYACKTLQNIYTQGTRNHLSRFVSVDIAKILMDIACRGTGSGHSGHRGNTNGGGGSNGFERSRGVKSVDANASGGLRSTAMRAIAQLVLHHHQGTYKCKEVLQRCLTADLLPTLLEGISDTRSRSLPSFLDVINFVLIHSTGVRKISDDHLSDTTEESTNNTNNTTGVTSKHDRRRKRGSSRSSRTHVDGEPLRALSERLLRHARFLPSVLSIMEHASSLECRGRSLVTLHMAVINDITVLGQACRRRLMSILDRLFKMVDPHGVVPQGVSQGVGGMSTAKNKKHSQQQDRPGMKYLNTCLRTTCRFLVHAAVSQVASSVAPSERLMDAVQGREDLSSGAPPMRSPTYMRELAKATTNAERSFPTLLQLLNSTHLTKFFQDVDVIRIVSRHVRIVTAVGKSNRQTARQGYRRVVFLVVETISQRPALVRSNREKVVSHLLPALASVFDGIETLTDAASSRNGLGLDDILLCLRMAGDLLTHVLRSGSDDGNGEGRETENQNNSAYVFFREQMLPKYGVLLSGPDPLPQLALRILFTVLDRNVNFVSDVEDARLVRRVVSCLTVKNGRTLERESSVHAARVLWCVMTWESTSMLLLHTYDVVHRLRQATIVARRTNAASCYEPLLACTEALLLHGCEMVRTSGGSAASNSDNERTQRPETTSLTLTDVREYIRELLNVEYLEVLTSLVANPKGDSAMTCEEVQLRASQCILLTGQFLGSELYSLLLGSQNCLNGMCTFLEGRYQNAPSSSSAVEDRSIQASMRTLQTLTFACDYDKKYVTMIVTSQRLVAALNQCEQSNDGRDLKTAVSGSWAGLSVAALAHVLNQKLRSR